MAEVMNHAPPTAGRLQLSLPNTVLDTRFRAALDRMAQIAAAMAKDPAVQKQMANFGSVAVANTPAEFARSLREETKLWGDLVKQIGGEKK